MMGRQYDAYDRTKPKVFVGEFAANKPAGAQTLRAAIAESVFMLGFERNADVVVASAFAPVLNNVHGNQWPYNLINFNASHLFCLPSYYAQLMLSSARGSYSLTAEMRGDCGLWNAAASLASSNAGVIGLKLANYDEAPRDVTVSFASWAPQRVERASATVLTAPSADAENDLEAPEAIRPRVAEEPTQTSDGSLHVGMPPWSLMVIWVHMSPAATAL